VVRHLSHRIIVLYKGRIMEQGDAETVNTNPLHPYTQALLAAAPVPDPQLQRERRAARAGRPPAGPDPALANACPFAARCPFATELCRTVRPRLETAPNGSTVACHRWKEIAAPQRLTTKGGHVHAGPEPRKNLTTAAMNFTKEY
jgi:oligopeptide/dipeptide ABC transporter ATP-binding protein